MVTQTIMWTIHTHNYTKFYKSYTTLVICTSFQVHTLLAICSFAQWYLKTSTRWQISIGVSLSLLSTSRRNISKSPGIFYFCPMCMWTDLAGSREGQPAGQFCLVWFWMKFTISCLTVWISRSAPNGRQNKSELNQQEINKSNIN